MRFNQEFYEIATVPFTYTTRENTLPYQYNACNKINPTNRVCDVSNVQVSVLFSIPHPLALLQGNYSTSDGSIDFDCTTIKIILNIALRKMHQ